MNRCKRRGRINAVVTGAVVSATAVGGCTAGSGSQTGRAAITARPATTPSTSSAAPSIDAAAWHKWGLTPLPAAPMPPVDKPIKLTATGPVPVFTHIPTTQKVVFLTFDDGEEKDPKFIAMMRDLKVPITMFLMDDAIKSDYAYFKPLQALGNHIQNHTLHHPVMSSLPLAGQEEEVCGDQKIITQHYGRAPLLFRPPYGMYNTNTKIAVGKCGPRAIVWWRESMQISHLQYQIPDGRLHPGDIILAHFRGPSELKGATMTQMFASLLERIQEQGFAVARLEDYIQPPAR